MYTVAEIYPTKKMANFHKKLMKIEYPPTLEKHDYLEYGGRYRIYFWGEHSALRNLRSRRFDEIKINLYGYRHLQELEEESERRKKSVLELI